jgi:large subunit ribosomal protein L24e
VIVIQVVPSLSLVLIKTELCAFSGHRIYPGHGMRFIRGDCKTFMFGCKKSKCLFHQKCNPRLLCWTQIYRRLHKKGAVTEMKKKRARKSTFRVQRGYVGASLDFIKQKRAMKPEQKATARDAALREIKDRKQKQKAHAVAARATGPQRTHAPKQVKRSGAAKTYTSK